MTKKMTELERAEFFAKYGRGSGGVVGGRGSFTPGRSISRDNVPSQESVEPGIPQKADELRLVGKPVPVVDAIAKVTGQAKYANDISLPGQLYAKTLRSPYPHAKIASIDISKAKALPGVAAILTADDMPPTTLMRPLDYGPILNKDRVRLVGDAVAVIAAVDEDTARQALELIEVEYEPLPFVLDEEEAAKPGAPQLYEEGNIAIGSGPQGEPSRMERGDVEKGLAEADQVFEQKYKTSHQVNSSPGMRCAVCEWMGDELTMYINAQGTSTPRNETAWRLGIPASKVKLISEYSTGGYGSGNHASGTNNMKIAAALLSKITGKPIKMEFSREEELILGMGRHPHTSYLKLGVKADGTITAVDVQCFANTGAHGDYRVLTDAIGHYYINAYKTPNARFEGTVVTTNRPSAREMRGFGAPQAHFALCTMLDEIAHELKMDPLDLLLKNATEAGDPWTTEFGTLTYSSGGMKECLTQGAEAFGWRELRQKYPVEENGIARGVGVAATVQGGVQNRSSAMVEVNPDGTVTVREGAGNMGNAAHTTMAQVVGEVLGYSSLDDIRVVFGHSDKTPHDNFSYGSRTALCTGLAFQRAAEDAKRQLFELAAPRLEVKPEELDIQEKRIFVKDNQDKSITLPELLGSMLLSGSDFAEMTIIGRGNSDLLISPQQSVSIAAHFVEVEVDKLTGDVRVVRAVCASDMGRALNRRVVEGQIIGAFVQGLGYAFGENMTMDRPTGIPVTYSWLDYKLVAAPDMPEVTPVIVESIDPQGAFGAKGLGETNLAAPAPAIGNAIFNAVGVRIRELPFRPDKIIAGLKA
ncbi:MAG: xanthine dehydrogenase family protein molybdopterin-binding subunit [Anaerolineae bacterium]